MVDPFISRKGGKKRLKNTIVPMIPEHKTYVEPFIGGGSIFLKKKSAQKSIINDTDKEIYKLWKTMKNSPNTLTQCKVPTNKKKFDNIKNKKVKTACDILGQNKSSYLGEGTSYIPLETKCPNDVRRCGMKSIPKKLPKYKEKLKTTKVLNEDYKKVFNKYDGKSTFTYMDPPYWETSNDYGGMKNNVHPADVCKIAKKSKGKVMISYNDHPEVRKSCKGLNIMKVNTKYEAGRNRNFTKPSSAKEVIITNYKVKKKKNSKKGLNFF